MDDSVTDYKSKTSLGKKSAEGADTSVAPKGSAEPNRSDSGGSLFARRLAAYLRRPAPGQKISNVDKVYQALIERAVKGDMKAIEKIIESLRLVDAKKSGPPWPTIHSGMSMAEAMPLYLASIKRTTIDDEVPRWSRAFFARRLAAMLKRTEPGQKISNYDRVCLALIGQAHKGNMKALQLIMNLIAELDTKPNRAIAKSW